VDSAADLRIGVVGVGRMGANIARRLHDQRFRIAALHDARSGAAEELAGELGSHRAASLAEVTERSDVVITVVTDDAAMRAIYAAAGSGDSLLTGAGGRLFVNCATVSPAVHVEVERAAEGAGAQSLEACMASSITQAREGTLYLMVGGKRDAYDHALPLLRAMSKDLRYVGPAGTAAQVKALVNMVMNINTAGLAEGLGLGAALGLDLAMLREVFSQTGAASRVLETDGADMQNRDHEVYFSGAHAAKDSGIALALAREAGLTLPVAEATKRQFDRMVEVGLGELDKSGVAELTFPGRGPQGP
jgi:3-hydroxyisobutyrate dehydrogenase-like beta-hydroxyacid dehydrogenase